MDNIFVDGELVDSTESINNLELQRDFLLEEERSSKKEYDLTKLVLHYIDSPAVNTFIKCEVVDITNISAKMPEFGCVVSFGGSIQPEMMPAVGEILYIHY